MLNGRAPGPDYTLRWPRELFAIELEAVSDGGEGWIDQMEWLLEEAFVSDQPLDDFRSGNFRPWYPSDGDPLQQFVAASGTWSGTDRKRFVAQLRLSQDKLAEQSHPRPYYRRRHDQTRQDDRSSEPDWVAAKQDWFIFVERLRESGYLDQVAPHECVDMDNTDPVILLNQATNDRIGQPPAEDDTTWWPLDPSDWSDPAFLDLVEVVHDLVSRPRRRWYHGFSRCGYHYSKFAVVSAQILYRWSVNAILDRHRIPLQLAKSGEDIGRLLQISGDPRDDLVRSAGQDQPDGNADRVAHAIKLFRVRGATVEDKRSACRALADVLENRKPIITAKMNRKDASELFYVANKFGIRHHDGRQQTDYPSDYLDWIFWWYLGTVELTKRLLIAQGDSDG